MSGLAQESGGTGPRPAPPGSGAAAVELRAVSFGYLSSPVLSQVDLVIQPGQFVGLVGPNGGGKTTLARLILGLLTPWNGSVRVFGRPPRQVAERLAYTPQRLEFDPLFPLTVLELVLMGRLPQPRLGPHRLTDREQARQALDQVGLGHRAEESFASLSGGQQQRVLIARALAGNPDLLVLDEPTANVDDHSEGQLREILAGLRGRLTVLMISHDLDTVSRMADCVACVDRTVHVHEAAAVSAGHLRDLLSGRYRDLRHVPSAPRDDPG